LINVRLGVSASAAMADEHKAQGNEHFKAGEFLKAAASYTKALKLQPDNHVLYSNRAQAFLKLNKVTKALDDAEKCISLAPDFVKGYHRKASALHAMGDAAKSEEAVAVLLAAIDLGLDDKELVRLGVQISGKAFVKQVDALRKGTEVEPEPAAPAAAPASATPEAKKAKAVVEQTSQLGNGAPAPPLWKLDAEAFAINCIKWVLDDFGKTGNIPTVCFLQPPVPKLPTDEPPVGQVNIKPAFSSPETLIQCADFLRDQIKSANAPAAAILVRKSTIGYPCVWKDKKGAWPVDEKEDGIFMQLESANNRTMFFTVIRDKKSRSVGDTVPLDVDQFGLFPRLYR